MNKLFLFLFVVSCITSMLTDRKELKEANAFTRGLYFALCGSVLVLVGLRVFGVEVALPTKLVVHTFIPWAKDMMQNYQ